MERFAEYQAYDALALADLVRKGDISARELLIEARTRLAPVHEKYNVVASQSDVLAEGLIENLDHKSLFCGVPFLVKDLMLPFAGIPMSNGSAAMRKYIPPENSQLANKLCAAGLVTCGKTTTSELGASSLVNTAAFGPTLNPWDETKNSGGSSGGSSVVVATRVVPMAYSSDGGGSIRLPASYCGIFGYKPSKGLNLFEDMSGAWGGAVVSHVSTVSVRDSAAYLDLVSGKVDGSYELADPHQDSYLFAATRPEKKLTIGLVTESPTATGVHSECISGANTAAKYCEALGHSVEQVQWNFDGRETMRAFLTIVLSYTSRDVANMARLLHVSEQNLDIELTTRFMSVAGKGISPDAVSKAFAIWEKTKYSMSELHKSFDIILTPTVATVPLASNALDPSAVEKLLMRFLLATGLGKKIVNRKFLDSLIDKSLYQTPFTPIANITGQPAMSVPLYWDQNGLPHGAHFMAEQDNDRILFMLARQLELLAPWRDKLP